MRRSILVAVAVIFALILVLLPAAHFVNLDRYRPQIQSELEKKLNRPVHIGRVELGLFPVGGRLYDVEIEEPPSLASRRPFAKAKEVYASVGLFSLLRKQPHVKSIRMDQPQIELIRDANGVWNFSTLGEPSGAQQASSQQPSLDKLQIADGAVSVTDLANHQPRVTYDHIDLTLTDFAPGKRMGFTLAAHLSGPGKQLVSASGKVGPLKQGDLIGTPMDAHVSLQEVSLASARQFGVQSIPDGTDAVASGEADIRTNNGNYNCTGKLKFDKSTVRNVQLGFPIDADYKIDYDPGRSILNVQSVALRIGSTPFSGSGELDASRTPYQVSIRVNTQNAPLVQLARLASAFGVAFNPKYTVNGNLTANLMAKGEAAKPSLTGTLNLANLEVSGNELKQPVRVPQLGLALSPDEIRSQPFQAESGGTHVTGQFTVAKYTSPDPMIDGSLKTDGASVAELLSMAKAYGIGAVDGMNGSGNVSVDFHIQGPISRTQALNYSGSGSLSNVVLNLPSVAKPIEVKTGNLKFEQDAVSVDNFAGSVGSSDLRGRVTMRNLATPQLDFDLASNKIDTSELEQVSFQKAPPQQKAQPQAKQASNESKTKQANNENGIIQKASGSGNVSIGTLVAKTIVLTNVRAKCLLDHGLIKLNPISSELFGGTQSGTIEADMRQPDTAYSLNTKLAGVDVDKLLAATTSLKDNLTGKLTSGADLKFIQDSGGEIARTLNGNVTFAVDNGRVKNLNLMNELAKVGKFVKVPASGGSGTDLKKLGGTLHIINGVANTDNLIATLDSGSLSSRGSINFVNQTLDMHMTAVLSNGLSQTVGGSQIGGYLNTALANKKGELVLPVIVTGTLSNPSFAPDAESMAKMKLQNLLPTTGNPSSAIEGVLGGLGAKPSSQQNHPGSPNQNKPEDMINNLLKGFGAKKPEQKKQ